MSNTRSRSEKRDLLAALLVEIEKKEALAAISYLTGSPRQSPLGVGYAAVYEIHVSPSPGPQLEILEVDATLELIASTSGPGSKQKKHDLLHDLLSRATIEEQEFLRGLMLRNLRQGALEGVMADAVAQALKVSVEKIRRAAMLKGDLVEVTASALATGPESLDAVKLEVFTPIQPMLASSAGSVTEAIESIGPSVIERKLDGLRLQVHKDSERVEVYTRNLRNVTSGMSSVIDAALKFPATRMILDGEGLVVGDDGSPMSFQDSMSQRSGADGESFKAFYFDVLHVDGDDLLDLSLTERRKRLADMVPPDQVVASIETGDTKSGERFFTESVNTGFEGVVVKDPAHGYTAGRRGSAWLKVKPTHTLDLVILGAEWGSGRRQGWLSNLHLGARDPDKGFVMLGKTFKGLTDEMLAWQTERFLEIETHREGHVVFLRPEIVYEIAFDGVQRSSRYHGGVALRFARVKRYRKDKNGEDADTLSTVRSYL